MLVLITGFYAFATFRILRANEQVVAVMRQQTEAFSRPYIAVTPFMPEKSPMLYLRISNSGKTAAANLRLSIDRDFYPYGDQSTSERNLGSMSAFNRALDSFPPDAELIFALAQGFVLFGESVDEKITPLQVRISATYSFSCKTVTETTDVDLRPYRRSMAQPTPLLESLEKIRKELEKIYKALEKSPSPPN